MNHRRPRLLLCLSLSMSLLAAPAVLADETASAAKPLQSPVDFSNFGGANTEQDSEEMWQPLREKYFADRPIIEGADSKISINAPSRAENDAMVPVNIKLLDASTTKDPFKKVYLVVDVNPAPMGGIFTLTDKRAMEQIDTQVRVNGYTYIRTIAETASGQLYMAKQWVRSTGAGCSAPPGTDQAEQQKTLGNMRFVLPPKDSLTDSKILRLMVSHPNNTGMQKDQLTTLPIPEHYVTHVDVSFNSEELLQADTTFTLSENPTFSFNFDPNESGTLRAEMTDSKNNKFKVETVIQGPG